MTDENENVENEYKQWLEMASLSDFITQYGSGASLTDIKLTDLYRYLRNPYAHIKEIQRASKYLTNKHGILKDVIRTIASLPSLNYHLHWSSYSDVKRIKKYEQKVQQFLDEIDVKKVVRDGLREVSELGSLVTCLRSGRYVQFLDLDDLLINKQRNGKWVILFDLMTIDNYRSTTDKLAIIESLPEEVTVEKYNLYRKKGEDYRYVELSNCDLISIDSRRNFPYGLPFTLGAWESLLQKEIINRVERSVADRLIKQIFILKAGYIDKDSTKLVPKETIQAYFKEISKLLVKKDGISNRNTQDTAGTGLISLLQGLELEALDVNTELFKKELYEKIDQEIYSNLGISSAIIHGGGNSNYSSAQMNSEKLYRYIFTILEQFERIFNDYIKKLLPNNLSCKLVFDRSTITDKDKMIDKYRDFYLQTGIVQPWIESLLGVDYQYAISQAEYEKKVLNLPSLIYPAANAYTNSGNNDDKGGKPSETNPTSENTNKSKTTGNNNPRPSTK